MENPFNGRHYYPSGEDIIAYRDWLVDQIDLIENSDADDSEIELVDAADELGHIEAFISDAESSTDDWPYDSFIPDADFEDYARELAEDVGAIDRSAGWPACHIDWEAAADSLKMDYTALEYRGRTYWAR